MSDAPSEKNVLTQALAKVNALPAGAQGDFLPAELQALRAFVATRSAEAPTERERAFFVRVEELLQHHDAADASRHSAELQEEDRRKNALLRTGIDKCLQGRLDELSEAERRVVESTAAQLNSLTDPSASHIRLRGLVMQALAAVAALEEARVEEISPALSETRGITKVVEAETFFEGGTRTRLREFSEIPIETNARVIEHAGNLEIRGNVPDDVTLVVREGGVVVHGQCEGNVLAQGTVEVHGNIAGAWTVSLEGDIRGERVLAGANLLAPHGTVDCNALERPGRIYAGTRIHVGQDVRGGHLISSEIAVDGTLRGAQTQVLKSLVCGNIVGDAREYAQVTFRNMLSSEDFSVSMTEDTLTLIREGGRFRFRQVVGESMVEAIRSDFCALQCARLYALSGATGVDLGALRTLQSKAAYFPVAIAIGAMLEQVLLEALEFEGDAQAAALNTGTDECQQAVRFLEREVGYLSDDLTRETKAMLISMCKHLTNLAKKIRESAGQRAALEEEGHALYSRLTEWRSQEATFRGALGEVNGDVRAVIGEGTALEHEPTRLGHAVATAIHNAGPLAGSQPLRSMKVLAERYVISLSHYTQGAAEVLAECHRLGEKIAADRSVSMGGGRNAERFARATVFGPHVVLGTSPGLSVPNSGGAELEEGRTIRVDRQLPGPAVFVCDGLALRRHLL